MYNPWALQPGTSLSQVECYCVGETIVSLASLRYSGSSHSLILLHSHYQPMLSISFLHYTPFFSPLLIFSRIGYVLYCMPSHSTLPLSHIDSLYFTLISPSFPPPDSPFPSCLLSQLSITFSITLQSLIELNRFSFYSLLFHTLSLFNFYPHILPPPPTRAAYTILKVELPL